MFATSSTIAVPKKLSQHRIVLRSYKKSANHRVLWSDKSVDRRSSAADTGFRKLRLIVSQRHLSAGGFVLRLGIETWASLGTQTIVADDFCRWISSPQTVDELSHGSALCRGASVTGIAIGVQSADVAHAYGASVVALAVSTYLRLRSSCLYCAVEEHHIMVAYGDEASLFVPTCDVGCVERLARLGGRAVDNDFVDLSVIHDWSDGVFNNSLSKSDIPNDERSLRFSVLSVSTFSMSVAICRFRATISSRNS